MKTPQSILIIVLLQAVYLESALCKDGTPTKTSFEDARCKCVCPKFKKDDNSTLSDKTVYISPNADPSNCNCGFVVNQPFCSMCECKYENRNTTTIKDDQTVSQVPQFDGARPRVARQKSVINYVSDEQKRWKSTVQEQRRNIYDKHTMLN
ncbi:putative protein 2 isoform X3 [Ruditapes philippinarum]|uniref:putative protein 2 isoform X3 n=1 Tax=Ruditapes philippinarum TaxID=129788 RepID=UPI00295BFED1|nr:putative protein 2 isoform X3 [Ruditapes philippinarum]